MWLTAVMSPVGGGGGGGGGLLVFPFEPVDFPLSMIPQAVIESAAATTTTINLPFIFGISGVQQLR
jgi:hypothetical protein